jgi:hypothetical protein
MTDMFVPQQLCSILTRYFLLHTDAGKKESAAEKRQRRQLNHKVHEQAVYVSRDYAGACCDRHATWAPARLCSSGVTCGLSKRQPVKKALARRFLNKLCIW